jgi:hypothetical protein
MLRMASSSTKTAVLLLLLGLQAKANSGDGYHGMEIVWRFAQRTS